MTISTVFGTRSAIAALEQHGWATTSDSLAFADIAPIHTAFPAVVDGRFDAAELAIVTFLQAFDNGRPISLLPVTLLGRFQHHTLVTLDRAEPITAESLAGKRVGVRSWSQTTAVWVRGFLADDYGIDVESVDWVVYENGHLPEFADPPYARRSTSGNRLPQDFLAGAVDAAILGNELPSDPRVRTVLSDPARSAAAWYGRTGAVPLNHLAVVQDEFARRNGDFVAELCSVIAASADHPPAITSELDLFPCGFDALAPSLDLAGRYAYQQGLISRPITAAEIRAKTEDLTGADLGTLPETEVAAA